MSTSKLLYIFLLVGFLSSCSFLKRRSSVKDQSFFPQYTKSFELVDKSGKFDVIREVGLDKKKNYVSKYRVISNDGTKEKILEQAVVLSTPGQIGKGLNVLRPKLSQYMVWFDEQKYLTTMKIVPEKKSMLVVMESPEKQWNGQKMIKFPDGNGVFCYFSQVMECASITGFVNKAVSSNTGSMNFVIVWDGFPYIQEQYLNMKDSLFQNAKLEYDGTTNNGEKRFSLTVGNNVIIYLLNKKHELEKMFWISQGFSMIEKGTATSE